MYLLKVVDISNMPETHLLDIRVRKLTWGILRPTVDPARHSLLGDYSPAAELMEYTVAQVSRYLDRIGAPPSTRKRGLLLVAYCRARRRYAAKSSRLELVGGSGELSNHTAGNPWVRQVDARLDFEKIVRQLSERNAAVLTLRAAEYEWKEIAQLFGVSAGAIRNAFRREIEKIRCRTPSV